MYVDSKFKCFNLFSTFNAIICNFINNKNMLQNRVNKCLLKQFLLFFLSFEKSNREKNKYYVYIDT